MSTFLGLSNCENIKGYVMGYIVVMVEKVLLNMETLHRSKVDPSF